jgi:hypothetical protein
VRISRPARATICSILAALARIKEFQQSHSAPLIDKNRSPYQNKRTRMDLLLKVSRIAHLTLQKIRTNYFAFQF